MLFHRQVLELVSPESGVSLDEVATAIKLGYEQDRKNALDLIKKIVSPHKRKREHASRARMACALAIGMILSEEPSELQVLLPVLRELARDPDPEVRRHVSMAIRTINTRHYDEFHTVWVGWLAHSDRDTRRTVIEGLAFVPKSGKTRKNTRAIFRVLSIGAGDEEEEVCTSAGETARELVLLGMEGAGEEILEWAGSSDENKRFAALVAVSGKLARKNPGLSMAVAEKIRTRRDVTEREKKKILVIDRQLSRAASG